MLSGRPPLSSSPDISVAEPARGNAVASMAWTRYAIDQETPVASMAWSIFARQGTLGGRRGERADGDGRRHCLGRLQLRGRPRVVGVPEADVTLLAP